MSSLASILPKPKHQPAAGQRDDDRNVAEHPEEAIDESSLDENPEQAAHSSKRSLSIIPHTLPIEYDERGLVSHDMLVRQGHDKGRLVQASLADLQPKEIGAGATFARPPPEEIARQMETTRLALERIVNAKIKSTLPKNVTSVDAGKGGPTFVKYTPNPSVLDEDGKESGQEQGASSQKQRIIRVTEMPKDPLQPPKHKHTRIPRPPPSPPAPVLHSPPRKVTQDELATWKIPPCISNWKNAKGYTIPLDKRLAADGRGLQEVSMNEGFAGFAEALYLAEAHAREEIEKRALVERKLAEQEKREKEESLRQLAQRAREEKQMLNAELYDERRGSRRPDTSFDEPMLHLGDALTVEDRERIRAERQREHERELRLSRMGAEQRNKLRAREEDRDISEKIALGVAQPSLAGKESMYDQRLFNQSEGIASGLNDDEAYNLYDKPLFAGTSQGMLYRPSIVHDDDEAYGNDTGSLESARLKPTRAFQGANPATSKNRTGPVEYERDVFGIDKFLAEARHGKRSAERGSSAAADHSSQRQPKQSRPN